MNRRATDNPLSRLNLTEGEMRRFQAIRIQAMADQVERTSALDKVGINTGDVTVDTETTDTDFLLELLERAITAETR